MKQTGIMKNQDGSALILVMILLMIVSIIGISALDTTNTEIQIFHNEKIYQKNFYQAESAVMEAAQRIQTESNIDEIRPVSTTKGWLVDPSIDLEVLATFLANAANSPITANASYSANAKGIVSGASLDMTSDSNVYGFTIYGYSADNGGNVFITIGYKKRM